MVSGFDGVMIVVACYVCFCGGFGVVVCGFFVVFWCLGFLIVVDGSGGLAFVLALWWFWVLHLGLLRCWLIWF